MTKNKIGLVLMLFLCLKSFSQTEDFQYRRTLENVSETWHKIILPEESFDKFNSDFSDVRIFGNNKTETPYILKTASDRISETAIQFKTINVSNKNADYFYTFELLQTKEINQIKLGFEQENFDWKLDLEASNNQTEWFLIQKDYRILSIKNSQTDYKFTQVDFPDSKYKFYRIKIKASEQPKLTEAKIQEQQKEEGSFKTATIKTLKKTIDAKKKTSVIEVELAHKVPVSSIKINIGTTFDYYRPVTIEILRDSVKIEDKWHYNYDILTQGTLSSLEKKGFSTDNTLAKKLRITIENNNNQPLDIQGVEVKNAIYFLIARFTEKGNYSLFYGNKKAEKPQYDIENFEENIPKNPSVITVSKEEQNPEFKTETKSALFENKIWLWILMGIIIVALAFYSLKMLRE
jgi:hypothetical protein